LCYVVVLHCVMLCYVALCYVVLCCFVLCCVMSLCVMLCYVVSCCFVLRCCFALYCVALCCVMLYCIAMCVVVSCYVVVLHCVALCGVFCVFVPFPSVASIHWCVCVSPVCEFDMGGPEGIVESHQITRDGKALATEAVDCKWFIRAPPRSKVSDAHTHTHTNTHTDKLSNRLHTPTVCTHNPTHLHVFINMYTHTSRRITL
jgi:hypothetical protein